MKSDKHDFIIDYDLAHCGYPDGKYDAGCGVQKFHPAYLITNENLRQTIPMFGNLGGDILTVAASGDQAMYYTMHGARRIDTFDMTFCARVIMDLKTAALANLSYVRYLRLIDDLYNAQRNHYDIMEFDDLKLILRCMPVVSAEFIKNMSKCDIFCAGITKFFESPRLSRQEYNAFQQNVKQPFNFIWSDIANLHAKLDAQYDVINTSNIFEWVDDKDKIVAITCKLFKFLKPGGYIQATAFYRDGVIQDAFATVNKQMVKSSRMESNFKLCAEGVVILRRVR